MASPRIRFLGDKQRALEYKGDVEALLGMVKHQMGFMKLQQGARRLLLENGVILFAASRFGQDEIQVYAPPMATEEFFPVPITVPTEEFFPVPVTVPTEEFSSVPVTVPIVEPTEAPTGVSTRMSADGVKTSYEGVGMSTDGTIAGYTPEFEIRREEEVPKKKKKEDMDVSFTLWFFLDLNTIVEYDPSGEALTGQQFTVDIAPEDLVAYSRNYDGGSILYAHDALWFLHRTNLSRIDIFTGEQTTRGVGSSFYGYSSLIAVPTGVVVVTPTGLTGLDKEGVLVEGGAVDFPTMSLISARLAGGEIYWYGEEWDAVGGYAHVDQLKVVKVEEDGKLVEVSSVTDIFAKLNTENGGELGGIRSNLAYDGITKNFYHKQYIASMTDGVSSFREHAPRVAGAKEAFTSGAFQTVWDYQFINSLGHSNENTGEYLEILARDVLIPIPEQNRWLALTSAGLPYNSEWGMRARLYDATTLGEVATTESDIEYCQKEESTYATGHAVWDGAGKVWFIKTAGRIVPTSSALVKVNTETAEITDMGMEVIGSSVRGAAIAVQPKITTSDGGPPEGGRTEFEWVLALQEASAR